jgi:hypothetical protein
VSLRILVIRRDKHRRTWFCTTPLPVPRCRARANPDAISPPW